MVLLAKELFLLFKGNEVANAVVAFLGSLYLLHGFGLSSRLADILVSLAKNYFKRQPGAS